MGKRFRMPAEGNSLQFRWEVFNAFDSVNFTRRNLQRRYDRPAVLGQYRFAESPRIMQFALRYEFLGPRIARRNRAVPSDSRSRAAASLNLLAWEWDEDGTPCSGLIALERSPGRRRKVATRFEVRTILVSETEQAPRPKEGSPVLASAARSHGVGFPPVPPRAYDTLLRFQVECMARRGEAVRKNPQGALPS